MNEQIKKLRFSRKSIFVSTIVLIIVVILVYTFLKKEDAIFESQVVSFSSLKQIVTETGSVEVSVDSDLAVEQSGKIKEIFVKEGDEIYLGDTLIQLDDSEQKIAVISARAQLQYEEANLANIKANAKGSQKIDSSLSVTIDQQDQIVEGAYQAFLNNDLRAYPEDNSDNVDSPAPIVSGAYQDTKTGRYIVRMYSSQSVSGSSIELSGLENGTYSATTLHPSPLGTKGLFLKFNTPENGVLSNYTWVIDIPNTRSTTYLDSYNNYLRAVEGAKVTTTQVENSEDIIKAQEARVEQARASLLSAELNLEKRNLTAPFTGIVSHVWVSRGEFILSGSPAISVISKNKYKISVDIPEDDIQFVGVGDEATVTFDAIKNTELRAHVSYIAPKTKTVDGVVVFEVELMFDEENSMVRPGLSADVNILTQELDEVITVPERSVLEEGGHYLVRVLTGPNSFRNQVVTLGLNGENGFVEIKDGLSVGDKIITFVDSKEISKMTEIKE